MTGAILRVNAGGGWRRVVLADYLDGSRDELATVAAHDWFKRVRHLTVGGLPFRHRFTFRGDSLWWFAELYLHKQQTILQIFRTVHALESLIAAERPRRLRLVFGDRIVRGVGPQIARAREIGWDGSSGFGRGWMPLARLDLRARWLTAAALASRVRTRSADGVVRPSVAAFVHRAFWRGGDGNGEAEAYIGPVLHALEQRIAPDGIGYVGVGPAANFSARRWWHAFRPQEATSRVRPIEGFASLPSLTSSRRLWRDRYAWQQALWGSADLRRHATIGGCDCWPLVREELAGIAWLQWPWSARAMDEAGAALDVLRPRVALTYAEAGGWGRALMLESRRRGIPSAGLQHGFIHRHWLNYLHEPDEMDPDPDRPDDRGFPRPSVTLVFDRYAASHLEQAGHFPPEALAVTGSPRLDGLVAAASAITADAIARAREQAGAQRAQALVVLVTKYREARRVLPVLIAAIADMPDVHLAIKTHPAETADVYRAAAGDLPNVRVLPASAPLAPLLRASRAIVTMNSTVALDAAVLDVPALVIGLPNNLTPFVEAGVMAGVSGADISRALRQILYDEEFRQRLAANRRTFLTRFGMGSDGQAASRSADVIVNLMREPEP